MNKFNLIDEKWIPTTAGLMSLRECFNEEKNAYIGTTAYETISFYKFLQAVSIAATLDKPIYILKEFKDKINEYLDSHYNRFYLYSDENRPFLQVPEIKEKSEEIFKDLIEKAKNNKNTENPNKAKINIEKLMFWKLCCSSNASLINDSDVISSLNDAEKAQILLINNGYCLNSKDADQSSSIIRNIKFTNDPSYIKYSKKGENEDANEGANNCRGLFLGKGYLHTFIFKETLAETFMHAQYSKSYFSDEITEIGKPAWEYDNVIPEDSNYKNTVFGMLIPMNRYIYFHENDTYVVEGINNYYENSNQDEKQPSLLKTKIIKNSETDNSKLPEFIISKVDSKLNPFITFSATSKNIIFNDCSVAFETRTNEFLEENDDYNYKI